MLTRLFLWLAGHECPNPRPVIRFSRATLCLSCDCLSESKHERCDFCGSYGSLLRLGQPLDGVRITVHGGKG